MSVPFRYVSRRRRLGRSTMCMLAFGLAGVYVNLPPLGPPGTNPSEPNRWKKCPECGRAVRPGPDGYCVCKSCYAEFEAADAKDF